MASAFEYEQDAIHVKAYYISSTSKEEVHRKFSVDPNLTTYEVLRTLLSRAFDLKQDDFRLNYFSVDQQTLPLLSDWDLDSAIISASYPFLQLEIIEHRPSISSATSSFDDDEEIFVHSVANANDTIQLKTNEGLLPSPDTIQNLVTTSNQAGANFILKHVNHTIPAITKRINKALALGEESGLSTLTSSLRSPTKSPTSPSRSGRPSLSDKEFRSFLDNVGELISPRELRLVIYQGGIEPQLRKVVWKHLLGVYPSGLNGKERLEYMRQKSNEYETLKVAWTKIFEKGGKFSTSPSYDSEGSGMEELKRVTNMVRKDVLRTDRQHRFYAGDGNENVTSLFNILTTYSLNHPSVAYCQGMSDLLSPILVTMMDEAHAYICFCALMLRLKTNFFIDGVSMTKKFQHLTDGLLYYDPEFFTYLKLNQADDLLYCYRWLLLEMKREFDFDDCFKVLEALWSSLPPNFPTRSLGLKLFEVKFNIKETNQISTKESKPDLKTASAKNVKGSLLCPRKQETAYSKVASLRRQTSGIIGSPSTRPIGLKGRRLTPNVSSDKEPRSLRIRSVGSTESEKSTTRLSAVPTSTKTSDQEDSSRKLTKSHSWVNSTAPQRTLNRLPESHTEGKKIKDLKDFSKLTSKPDIENKDSQSNKNGFQGKGLHLKMENRVYDSEYKTNDEDTLSDDDGTTDNDDTPRDKTDDEEIVGYSNFNSASKMKMNGANSNANSHMTGITLVCQKLPEPTEFGDGNPFLIFLCIACLLQHRNYIMQQQLDYQEIAMYFDKMVRKHDVEKTLFIARKLFAEYLNGDWSATNDSSTKDDLSPEDSKQNSQKCCDDKC